MSFYVEKHISVVSSLKSHAIPTVEPVFNFFYLEYLICFLIKTQMERYGYIKGKLLLKLTLIISLFPLSNAKFSFVHLKKPAINTFVDMHV